MTLPSHDHLLTKNQPLGQFAVQNHSNLNNNETGYKCILWALRKMVIAIKLIAKVKYPNQDIWQEYDK